KSSLRRPVTACCNPSPQLQNAVTDRLSEILKSAVEGKMEMWVICRHCPSGEDKIAHNSIHAEPEPLLSEFLVPAQWSTHPGKTGGNYRNTVLVDLCRSLDLDEDNLVCAEAFPAPTSVGTVDCIKKIQQADLPLHITEVP